MQGMSLGAGLAAMAFWTFIAAIVVAGIWYAAREQAAKQETLRRLLESGGTPDPELIDKLLGVRKRLDRDLTIAGLIVVFSAPGLALLGWCISLVDPRWFTPLLGVAALAAFAGTGLLVAARFAQRSLRDDAAAKRPIG